MIEDVSVSFDGDRREYRPGEVLSGVASWDLRLFPEAVVVRLLWRTSGRGTADRQVVEETRFLEVLAREQRPFRFTLPREPYSFSGSLISLTWAVEVVAEGLKTSSELGLVLAPGGREVTLAEVEEDPKKS